MARVSRRGSWRGQRRGAGHPRPRATAPLKSGFRAEQAAACLLARVYEADGHVSTSGARWVWTASKDVPDLKALHQLTEGDTLDTPDLPPPVQRWADWVIPDCFTDCLRLEYVLTTVKVAPRKVGSA